MCGILLQVNTSESTEALFSKGTCIASTASLMPYEIACRGPDLQSIAHLGNYTLYCSVLALRGEPTQQPILTQHGYFAYNGQVYNTHSFAEDENHSINDTQVLANLINSGKLDAFFNLQGPWSFVLLQSEKIIYGRDPLGRRSLLYSESPRQLSSVALGIIDKELDPLGIYTYCLKTHETTLQKFPGYQLSLRLFNDEVEEFHRYLRLSVQKRIWNIPSALVRLGILFSGGIDCTVLAVLAHEFIPKEEPIDLINVSFDYNGYNGPDRLTALQAYQELQTHYPRNWNLILINVTKDEYQEHRQRVVELMKPCHSVMDLSIAIAFYFAARGARSKVLFSGLGADEQLGGYSRHHVSYKKGGLSALEHEMKMDMKRIWSRNLGRDDRVISASGKEVRFPFLDEDVVHYLSQLPLTTKVDFTVENGNKLLLRKLTSQKLGLERVAKEPKRAIQFGSRTAKMEGKEKGTASIY